MRLPLAVFLTAASHLAPTRCQPGLRAAPAACRAASSMGGYTEGEDFFVAARESGSIRADLPVFGARPGAVAIPKAEEVGLSPSREDVPGIEGVFVLKDVLTKYECEQIIALSSAMGYTEDAPVSLGRDIRRNQNCVWIADEDTLNKPIFERCAPLLPQSIELRVRGGLSASEGPCVGLNARWRLYKYDMDDVFKKHTDGAWPGSGLSNGKVVQDVYGDRLSWLTFLMYLNDEADFEGGQTTFYPPGGMPVSVQPKQGNVLCFFHGQHPLSPLHEGSLVTGGTRAKFVPRSDVLYMSPT